LVLAVAAAAFGSASALEADSPAGPSGTVEADAVSFVGEGTLDLDAAVDYFENLYRSQSSRGVAELKVTKPRRTRTMRMSIWTQGEEKSLIVITSPAREEGTATLKVDENLWNYLPRIRRTIRIPPSMMLRSWMGTDFTNDDIVRESSFREDYSYELAGASEDPPGWLIRFVGKPGMVGLWEKFELLVSRDGTIPIQARYYDRKGRLARTLTWDQVRVFSGRRIPSRMALVPEDKEGYQTEMTYLELSFDVDVPEGTFSLSNLERKR
jgi:hypothetical protein